MSESELNMSRIAYFRVSTEGQSIEGQRKALGGNFDKEFKDEGVSGSIRAVDRPGFSELLSYVREGDTVCVTAIDRLGRDALDVQSVFGGLIGKGIIIDVQGLGPIAKGVGELVVAVLAQIADMERQRIKERCEAGRAAARASLAANGRTHKGKASLGRPFAADASAVAQWRKNNVASIAETAQEFRLSAATVKRYCAKQSAKD